MWQVPPWKIMCHPWCDLIELSYSDKVRFENPCMCFLEQLGIPDCVSIYIDIEISRETTLPGFCMDQMGTKLVHPHSTSKCFLQFKSQNPAVWQQTAQKSNSSVLTSWKIPSLPAGKNQPLPDHLIAFEIINWILYCSSPVFFHCGF